MKYNIRKLMLINVLFYINNYAYTIFCTTLGLSGIIEFWAFSPFILIFFTTIALECKNEKVYKVIKIQAIIDFILRVISIFINYYATTFLWKSFSFNGLLISEFVLMSINIYLEFNMYRKIKNYENRNNVKDEGFSKNEIDKTLKYKYFNGTYSKNKNFRLGSLSGTSIILMYCVFLWTGIIIRVMGEKNIILTTSIMLVLLTLYLFLVYLKLKLFYPDNKLFKKIFIRDNISFISGLILIYVSEGYIYSCSNEYNFIIYIIASLTLIPSFLSNRNISIYSYNEIRKK